MSGDTVPVREIFQSLTPPMVAAFYVLAGAALGVFACGVWLRVRKYRTGRPVSHGGRFWKSAVVVARAMLAHSTLKKRDRLAGIAHWLIFWGFAVLFLGSCTIALDQDVLRPISASLQFWRGTFYKVYSALLDVLGLGLMLGLGVMAVRRWGSRRPQFDYVRPDHDAGEYSRDAYRWDDQIFLWSLVCVGATGFVNEALRITADRPAFEVWSVVGWQLANGLGMLGLTSASAAQLHRYAWWLHAVLALGFIAYIPYSKAVHILAALANLFLKDPLAGRRLPAVPEGAATMSYRVIGDLTWKQLLELDACTKCGRCHVACPSRAGGWPLSPRDVILQLREHAEACLGGHSWFHEAPMRKTKGFLAGGVIKAETLWSCTTCLACVETCPVWIEHLPLMVQLRRHLVEEGTVDRNLQAVLERLARYGNSFGEPAHNRGNWTEGLGFGVKDARKEPVEFLWFVGDFASYDPGQRAITQTAARVLHRAGLDFGILYDGERNAGNDVRRIGEEGLFQLLAEQNAAALSGARFKEIVTTDPHSYNTLKHEYPALGAIYPVRHYCEVIQDLMVSGQLPVKRRLAATVTYHDPCHLSRYAQVTEAPRAVLAALGARLIEMERHHANSFCCGAGGGRIWMSDAGKGERPSEQRIREALRIPALETFVVACPKDLNMFREAVKATGNDARLAVKDLIELVDEATRE